MKNLKSMTEDEKNEMKLDMILGEIEKMVTEAEHSLTLMSIDTRDIGILVLPYPSTLIAIAQLKSKEYRLLIETTADIYQTFAQYPQLNPSLLPVSRMEEAEILVWAGMTRAMGASEDD